ncbi:MAG: bifunctional phosphoribosyl-AMP cyclohydrolase/phosphoribosyl-ATP diphosphatase HisIE [Clostridium sp.]|nr:bifunctional phosphoribosyl-AMP cyclohydrolase/phosphoribosyl-ATP diphosphatase HisIE [Clostridium sp.]
MTEYKKLIVGFQVREGRAGAADRSAVYRGALADLAAAACDNGADEVWIKDCSGTDEDHEAVIGLIKDTARAVDAPILAGGRVHRLEDVKKYLYAGASAVFLDVSVQENVDLMKEAADRFGREKIYAYLPEPGYLDKAEEYAQLGASAIALETGGGKVCAELAGRLEGAGLPCLLLAGTAQAEPLAENLACRAVFGAVLSPAQEDMDLFMGLKQQLKGRGLPMDTFESSVAWKDFKLNSDGLVPVIVQDYKTSQVLMLAYMNEEAFEATLRTGRMTYYSRSRKCLWLKGETSGHFQYVKALRLDCDNDTVLALVHQIGAACHTGSRTCFYQTLAEKEYKETNPLKVFEDVYGVILDRKEHPKEGSYTNYLFDKGIDKILKKLGEEATEIVIAAKNPNPEEVKYEISDFLYHMMVLMAEKGVGWEEITEELANR